MFHPNGSTRSLEQAPHAELPGEPLSQLIDALESGGRGAIMTMGKGGVGKTSLAAAIASELARRGHHVHLSTTDPAGHDHDAVGVGIPRLTAARIDPDDETLAYQRRSCSCRSRLRRGRRALLEEDLRSPCTEEIAVFRAFADASPRAWTDSWSSTPRRPGTPCCCSTRPAYHRDIARGRWALPDAVAQLLPRLRDPEYTRVLIVTLPEATPVHEAARLSEDPTRRHRPVAWVVNQSLAAAGATHPTLAARARDEHPYLAEGAGLAGRLALVAGSRRRPPANRD